MSASYNLKTWEGGRGMMPKKKTEVTVLVLERFVGILPPEGYDPAKTKLRDLLANGYVPKCDFFRVKVGSSGWIVGTLTQNGSGANATSTVFLPGDKWPLNTHTVTVEEG
ncbi:MAG: hypothetical protein US58_C0022G0027 [Candidatus Magasanikbacteria bacterium GW2011_GWA2_37_8]|uniref:Uncharacterized protein n=1 Tax=Candidatus Magasanikbacteria bacterium GW2011_GWA2_37_8 TaxID=1619036 RepID=A0A0G0HAI3_9BACT|nr:MAG: hypothetical protein US58_C0022G0027 [Candidatus Magasanikbacteria bacterium GW2011_GWA2_37_8]